MNEPSQSAHSARLGLLLRRWALPEARASDVLRLIEAETSGETAVAVDAPKPEAWGLAALEVSGNHSPSAPRPLVLCTEEGISWLQSWSFHQAESAIARRLVRLASEPGTYFESALFGKLEADLLNEGQRRAVRCALERRMALITGGPGTGKTHTLARYLALEFAARTAPARVALAAPTGKAAERMREAIEQAAANLPASLADQAPALRAAALGTSTLHRLLGYHPANGRCRRNAEHPLDCEVLIVDEVSMVDTFLWHSMLEALPEGAKLVLLGDPNQLESVAPGAVLASLIRSLGEDPNSPLRSAHVELTESHRFRDRGDIGALAVAVVRNDAATAVALLRKNNACEGNAGAGGVTWLGDHLGRFDWSRLPDRVREAILRVSEAATPREALAALSRVRLLTAHRDGSMGAAGLNAAVRLHLQQSRGTSGFAEPVIVNRNDPETGLKNGSVGVLMLWQGALTAFFPAQEREQEPQAFSPARLPDHAPAWAMTIHRSQGSEFEEVVVVLPEAASPLATRELVYTGITRARRTVHLWGSEETLAKAVADSSERRTLLGLALKRTAASQA